MTMPRERTRAVQNVKRFLFALTDPATTPRVPKVVREAVRDLLKHYPGEYDLYKAHKGAPDIWGPTADEPPKKARKR